MSEVEALREAVDRAMRAALEAQAREAQARGLSLEAVDRERGAEEREKRRARGELDAADLRAAWLAWLSGHIPAEDATAIVDDAIQPTDAVRHVRRWLRRAGERFVVLSGGVGTGKTVAACAAAHQVAKDPRDAALIRAPALARYLDPWRHEREHGERAGRVDHAILIVDDLGTERLDDGRFLAALEELVDRRLAGSPRRTIITTNLDAEHAIERVGGRIASRWRGHGRVIHVRGEDLRLGGPQ